MTDWKYRKLRATCSTCGRDVATHIPKDGDGSAEVAYRHNGPDGKRCDGSGQVVVEHDRTR